MAVTAQRASALPEVATMAESGLAGFDVSTWFGVSFYVTLREMLSPV